MPHRATLSQLRRKFAGSAAARFEEGPGGLIRVAVHSPGGDGLVYLHGAQVAEFRPAGFSGLLFMSSCSSFEPNRAIRGGVPVVFPWFGPRVADPTSPQHGFARVIAWELVALDTTDRAVELTFSLSDSPATREIWNHRFDLKYRVTVSDTLELSLAVRNTAHHPLEIEEAFHTYLAVSDVRQITVQGLAGATYADIAGRLARKTDISADGIHFAERVDRAYLHSPGTCIVQDPIARRELLFEKTNSATTVIWNPGAKKARDMRDLGDGQWTGFVCVEVANAMDDAITLAPGASHEMSAKLSARPWLPPA